MNIETQLTDERLSMLRLIQEQLSAQNGKLYVWGAAVKAHRLTSFIRKNSTLSIEAYVIDDAYYNGGTFLDRPIIKASEFLGKATENDWVIIGFEDLKREKELIKELPSFVKTVESSCFAIPRSADLQGAWIDHGFYEQHKTRFESTRSILADEISKNIMDAFIIACMTGSIEGLEGFRSNGEYFNELTSGCKSGCLVDCGAYTGDTIEAALDFLGSRLERVIAFEPDPENYENLKEYVQKTGLAADKIKILKKGSYDRAEVLHFSASSNTSSSVSENGEITIETDSIDNAAADMGEISFIKMDVEGSELKSILGAADTIRKYRPTMAICAYHKTEDLFELPETIRKITNDSGYKYYLRYHGFALNEVVLYAIPE